MPTAEVVAEPPRPDAGQPRGVCVGLLKGGKAHRLQADSAGEFLPLLANLELAWVNFAVDDLRRDGSQIASLLGFSGSLVDAVAENPFNTYEDRETELAIRLPVVHVRGVQLETLHLVILVRHGLVLTLHEFGRVQRMVRLSRYADTFMRKIPPDLGMNDKLTVLLTRLLNENNDRNFEGLRVIQEQGDTVGANLIAPNRDPQVLSHQVYEVKHLLVQYLNVLWNTLDVVQSLRYGDAELVSDDETLLARMGLIADDLTRQIQLSEHTTEVLVSGLEVLQSIYNNQLQVLNNRLAVVIAWLTILGTVILVPNTFATLFGPVTDYAPWERVTYFGSVVVITGVSAWLAYWWVRKRHLLRGA